ncbi:Uncharacterized protein APZ42_018651 [Daphnia magna]|uniref:Uncharacterized protein n=1 Tax=Daphnia magna TaxID=35525 RepID=A0A164YP73_9CRUS|nr:Uncharacterized protein APZ42_018651 [Daphnia magna]
MKKKKEKEEEGEKDEKYVKKKVKEATVIRVPDRRSWRATTKWPAKHGMTGFSRFKEIKIDWEALVTSKKADPVENEATRERWMWLIHVVPLTLMRQTHSFTCLESITSLSSTVDE